LAADNDDLVPGLWISALAWALGVDNEVAEAGNFYLLAALEAGFDDVERGFDDIGGVLFGEPYFFINARDDFRFRHFLPLVRSDSTFQMRCSVLKTSPSRFTNLWCTSLTSISVRVLSSAR